MDILKFSLILQKWLFQPIYATHQVWYKNFEYKLDGFDCNDNSVEVIGQIFLDNMNTLKHPRDVILYPNTSYLGSRLILLYMKDGFLFAFSADFTGFYEFFPFFDILFKKKLRYIPKISQLILKVSLLDYHLESSDHS